jgi:hypothetical protein
MFPGVEPADGGLLDGLDRLESALSALPPDAVPALMGGDDGRDRVSRRLRQMLARWDELRGHQTTVTAESAAATDEELFELLDRRLGESPDYPQDMSG